MLLFFLGGVEPFGLGHFAELEVADRAGSVLRPQAVSLIVVVLKELFRSVSNVALVRLRTAHVRLGGAGPHSGWPCASFSFASIPELRGAAVIRRVQLVIILLVERVE